MIEKRDGRKVPYNSKRITNAVSKAAVNDAEYTEEDAEKLAEYVLAEVTRSLGEKLAGDKDSVGVEAIQDAVEQALLKKDENVYKKYCSYRSKRSYMRECRSDLIKNLHDLMVQDAADNDSMRENANINADSPMGAMLKYGSTASKYYYLNNMISEKFARAHMDGEIHIHDLDFYGLTMTCCQIDLEPLFERGFSTGHGYVRTPNSIASYAALAAIVMQANQNDQHGGQSLCMFDYNMAPGVAKSFIKNVGEVLNILDVDERDAAYLMQYLRNYIKLDNNKRILTGSHKKFVESLLCEKLDYNLAFHVIDKAYEKTLKDTYQAMEGFIHNLNTMASRAGAQVPFTSINFGTDTSVEGRMVSDCFLRALEKGLGSGETSIFPISVFKIRSGYSANPGDPNYDLFKKACEVSAKRLFPNFLFLDAPYNSQFLRGDDPRYEVATMGCVRGDSKIAVTFEHDYKEDNPGWYDTTLKELFDKLTARGIEPRYRGQSTYYDLDKAGIDVRIWDTSSFIENDVYKSVETRIRKVIRNSYYGYWVRITLDSGEVLECTPDHPLPVVDYGRKQARHLCIGEKLYRSREAKWVSNPDEHGTICKIELLDCSEYLDDLAESDKSYDVETESDFFDVNGIISHNCRTRVIGDIITPDNQQTPGRGNLSFTTINLPRIALKHRGDVDGFFTELDEKLDLVFDQLVERLDVQSKRHVYNFPFLMGQGVWIDSDKLDKSDTVGEVIKHGTLTVGFIALAEALKALIGVHHGESEKAQELGLKIVKHMRERCDAESKKRTLNFSLIATPAEGLTGRMVRKDQKVFGKIEGITDRDYYTNSFHLPVYFDTTAHKKITLEAPYHELCNGGHITYIEVDGDPAKNVEAFEQLVKFMGESGCGYVSINHPVDHCPVCHYSGIIGDICPRCGRHDGEGVDEDKLEEIKAKYW